MMDATVRVNPAASGKAELLNAATALEASGRWEDARRLYEQCHEATPFMRDLNLTVQELRCSINLCHWQRYEHLQRILTHSVDKGGYVLGETTLASPALTAQQLRLCMQRAADRHTRAAQARFPSLLPGCGAKSERVSGRVRVGFLGCDYSNQATSYLMVGLIEVHDRDAFEYIAFDYGRARDDDPLRQRIKAAFDGFHHVADLDNAALAAYIARHDLDVLLFLKSPTDERCGVLARRCAPIQLAYLYYPSTFGGSLVDGLIADEIVVPNALECHYSEPIVRLPRCYQPNDPRRPLPRRISREEVGLPRDAFVLANFGQAWKITPAMFDLWCTLLRRYPQCVLWLLDFHESTVRNLRMEADIRGIAQERLIFGAFEEPQRHLSRLTCADLMLDTNPYGGHTGTSDALWAGVPVLTLTGETFASRVAASLLHAVGLDELVAGSAGEYLGMAGGLIEQPERVSGFKAHLDAGRAGFSLFDVRGYARDFESMLGAVVRGTAVHAGVPVA